MTRFVEVTSEDLQEFQDFERFQEFRNFAFGRDFQDFQHFQDRERHRGYRISFRRLFPRTTSRNRTSRNEDWSAVAATCPWLSSGGHEDKEEKERERERGGIGEKESRRIVFVIKLTRMGLINLCESIKQVL